VRLPPVVLALTALLTTSACDPEEAAGQDGAEGAEAKLDPAKAAADAAAKEREQAKQEAAGHFAVCMAGCIEGRAQSPTDRQTCRLTCGADRLEAGGPGPSPSSTAALARWQTCVDDGCGKGGSATDAATCRLNCAQTALTGGVAQGGDCGAACAGDADGVATGRMQCSGAGERCLGRCEAEPTTTPTKPAAARSDDGSTAPKPSTGLGAQ